MRVGLLGATGLVGSCLLPLLTRSEWEVIAFSRQVAARDGGGVRWQRIADALQPLPADPNMGRAIPYWVCLAPIWVLPDYFPLLEAHGARCIVALSSTSRFSKNESPDPRERAVAQRLAQGEERLCSWAEGQGARWVILRPTLIYGHGCDKNISEIARFVRRFGFFPVLGRAAGLRQPVHAEDVAASCFAALQASGASNRCYNLSGGEILTYKEIVGRVFLALGRRPRLVAVPLELFSLAAAFLRLLPRYRHWTAAMAQRMNRDLVFEHSDAMRDLGFSPRPFALGADDLPRWP